MKCKHVFREAYVKDRGKFRKVGLFICKKCGALKIGKNTTKILSDYIDMALLASAPTATEGRLYYNSSEHKLYYYNGTEWVEVVVKTLNTGGSAKGVWHRTGEISFTEYCDQFYYPAYTTWNYVDLATASITVEEEGSAVVIISFLYGYGSSIGYTYLRSIFDTEVVGSSSVAGSSTSAGYPHVTVGCKLNATAGTHTIKAQLALTRYSGYSAGDGGWFIGAGVGGQEVKLV